MSELTSIHFHRLFEVRLLHEFYLNNDTNRSFFSLDTNSRATYLEMLVRNNRYDIWKDLSVEPSEETKKILDGHQLRFVRSKTGFFIGIKIKSENNKLFPFISPAESVLFTFHIRIKNPYIRNFTNLRLNSTLPTLYFFSNSDREGTKVFPSLSLPVEEARNDKTYEQGELARFGSAVMEAITTTTSSQGSNWRDISSTGLAHEGDRILLPMRFYYKFEKNVAVTQAEFTLKTTSGVILKSIGISSKVRLDKILLDFSTADPFAGNGIDGGICFLEISGDGYYRQEKVFLNNVMYDARDLGVVEISLFTGDSRYDILEPDGSVKAAPTVFEIRLKSRITYWRYRSNNGIRFKTTVKTSPFLTAENGVLKSIKPVPMNAMPFEFLDENPAIAGVFLPNPPDQSLRVEGDGRVYSDIYLSGIKDLIIEDI